MVAVLQQYTKFPIPQNIPPDIAETVSRYGRVRLERIDETTLKLVCADKPLLAELSRQKKLKEYLGEKLDDMSFAVEPGVPRRAEAGAHHGRLPGGGPRGVHRGRGAAARAARQSTTSGLPFTIRDYQREAADVFHAGGDVRGGSGVIVLPCGAGKTIVGIAAMALLQKNDARPHDEHHRGEAVEARDSRQDDAHRGRGEGVHRRDQGDRPGDGRDVPDPDVPPRQDRGFPALRSVRASATGA